MSESGGPTTQSGITYQNSISALYMGRMCDATPRPERQQVVKVRVESPTPVDDTVVAFADEHLEYIQVKEALATSGAAWQGLWEDFWKQYNHNDFRLHKDRLVLYIGSSRQSYTDLKGLCERASTSESYGEWTSRLNAQQEELLRKITSLVDTLDNSKLLDFFRHVVISISPHDQLESGIVPYWMPKSNRSQLELFSLLRDKAGRGARVRESYTAESIREWLRDEYEIVLESHPGVETLKDSMRACGALLLQSRHTFGETGIELPRDIVEEILSWTRNSDEDNVAVLLDSAGAGKTVVMRDVLTSLESEGASVFAVKADQQLSGVLSAEDMHRRLGLPESVVSAVSRVASLERVVVLVDQIDALSLSMARDQRALDCVLEVVARLRLIPGVRILLSCRSFDLNNDPRLREVEISRRFSIPKLSDSEIEAVLSPQGVNHSALPRATRELLRVPLHLDLFVSILRLETYTHASGIEPTAFGVTTLQDLYSLLWKHKVLGSGEGRPSAADRTEVIRLLTEHMRRRQKTSAPHTIFTSPEREHLSPAVDWLASCGILTSGANEWHFLHQTFFDYCYARWFVEEDGCLYDEVLAGDQGLSARPQIVQVLAYLRGTDERRYLRELNALLRSEELRFHLRKLTFGWFGTLPTVSDGEWSLARRMLISQDTRPMMLDGMKGNPIWLGRLGGNVLRDLLHDTDEVVDQEVLPYLASVINSAQEQVIEAIRPYYGNSQRWRQRVRWMLGRIRDWETPAAVELFGQIFEEGEETDAMLEHDIQQIAATFPREGCELARRVLERSLNQYRERLNSPFGHYRDTFNEHGHSSYSLRETFKTVSRAAPREYVEIMLPWLEQAVTVESEPYEDSAYFAPDMLSQSVHDRDADAIQDNFVTALIDSLCSIARDDAALFRGFRERLSALPYKTPQQILSNVYRRLLERYAEDALNFLLADERRLNLGEYGQYESRKLIESIYPFLSHEQGLELENFILSYDPVTRGGKLVWLRWRGIERLNLLKSLPEEHLSERGRRHLGELERKFPDHRPSAEPVGVIAGFVASPIDEEAAARMSDRAWLEAMKTYQGSATRDEFLRGGASELSAVLSRRVKAEPERFYRLALQAPPDLDDNYARAFIDGLTESDVPAQRLFEVVERFASNPRCKLQRNIAWALEKRINDGLSDEMLDLLEGVVKSPMKDDETNWQTGEGIHGRCINSDRGSSLETLVRALYKRGGDGDKSRAWEIIEFVSSDPSTVLRSGAVEELLYIFHEDRARGISLFESLLEGHEAVLGCHGAQRFLHHGSYKFFHRIEPFLRILVEDGQEQNQQRGAELACLAAMASANTLGSEENLALAQRLCAEAEGGPVGCRRGVAHVYSRNIDGVHVALCATKLRGYVDDEDEKVRGFVSRAVHNARGCQNAELRNFIEAFARSRCADTGGRDLGRYLREYGSDDPDWALRVITLALPGYDESTNRTMSLLTEDEDFVRLVLQLYTDPTASEELRGSAMDVFDQLMKRHAYEADRVLAEWDDR